MFQATLQGSQREMGEARARKLNSQREPIQTVADGRHGGGILVGQPEVGADRARAIDEEGNRLRRGSLRGRHRAVRGRQC